MFNNFKSISLSYKNAPIAVREQIALDEDAVKQLLRLIKEHTSASEAVILSTCNRTEIYYCADVDLREELVKLLCIAKGDTNMVQSLLPYFNAINNHHDAITYLFKVALGLESKVIGDIQISNQIKKAYQWSVDEESSGAFLHRLLHTIFFSNKRVVQETDFRDGGASVAYVASEIAQQLASDFVDAKILLIGLGEIGSDVCRNLKGTDKAQVYVCNRTKSKAEELATECGFEAKDYEDVFELVQEADVILSSLTRDEPLIKKAFVQKLQIPGFKHFIDLSVPRSVELEVEQVAGVTLHNIDTLTEQTNKALNKRISAIPAVDKIIDEAVAEFQIWSKEKAVSPTIQRMKNSLEQIRQEEITRFLKNASAKESKMIDQVTKSMIQKIIKLPVLQLKAACKRDEAETLIDALNDIFDLNKKELEEKRY